eukprot:2429776-Rhodomonas_salina.1
MGLAWAVLFVPLGTLKALHTLRIEAKSFRYAFAMRCPVLSCAMLLRACYEMSGTEQCDAGTTRKSATSRKNCWTA